ncbi:hypothetical protein HG530_003001 [Fusarium avenaceum]|nr:hypothetical protein HG530_003001 [Fusarium avenaceum]
MEISLDDSREDLCSIHKGIQRRPYQQDSFLVHLVPCRLTPLCKAWQKPRKDQYDDACKLEELVDIFRQVALFSNMSPCRRVCDTENACDLHDNPLHIQTLCETKKDEEERHCSAQAENTDIFTMTCAFELRLFKSPIAALSLSLEKFSSALTRVLRILPMRSTSVTIPIEMKLAQTLTASEASSGDESAANAGSGSGVLPNIFKTSPIIFNPQIRSSETLEVEAENAIRTTSATLP